MIEIENLWKEYRLGNTVDLTRTFREMLTQKIRSGLSSKDTDKDRTDDSFWALKGVNLSVPSGRSLGLIGHNGAGKSTLLKVLSRITKPSRGEVRLQGSVASLLEVGTGFHPELSGRENIFLYGSIMGMTRREISKKFDDIVDYAGIEKFLDTPVKRYSSGMYVRLAFSIAAHVEPDILIVDEVLAVGDSSFREKCLSKMDDIANSGRTVIFVSHNMSSVATLCQDVAWLDQGQVREVGAANEIISLYENSLRDSFDIESLRKRFSGNLTAELKIESLYVQEISDTYSYHHQSDQDITIRIVWRAEKEIEKLIASIALYHRDTRVFTINDAKTAASAPQGQFESCFRIPANLLAANSFRLALGARETVDGRWTWAEDLAEINISDAYSDNLLNHLDLIQTAGEGYRVV